VKDWWSTFIHYDVPQIPQRNFDGLVAFMRERYGYTREKAEGEIARRFSPGRETDACEEIPG
jgi:hypothetical protein